MSGKSSLTVDDQGTTCVRDGHNIDTAYGVLGENVSCMIKRSGDKVGWSTEIPS